MEDLRDENGAVSIEAIIVYVVAIMVVFMLMNFAMFTYQKGNVTASANQAASDVANIYASEYSDPYFGYMDLERLKAKRSYRYFFLYGMGNAGSTSLDSGNKAKAQWYAATLIYKTEYLHPEKYDFSDIKTDIVTNSFGKRQLKVTIKRKYPMLAINPFRFLGLEGEYEYEATGYAECFDMIDYINKTNLVVELNKRILGGTLLESLAGFGNSIFHVMDIIKETQESKKK